MALQSAALRSPHPVSFSPSDGGNELTAYQSGELRWRRFRINAINPDYDGDDEEEDRDDEGEMAEEDGEIPSLKYRTVNDRAGGRLQAKYWTQQIGDAEPANSASREGEPEAPRGRVAAMNQRKMTGTANLWDRVQAHDWASNTGERRRHANPPGRVSGFHNKLPSS